MKTKFLLPILIFFVQISFAHRTEKDIMETKAGKLIALSKIGGEIGKFKDKNEGIVILNRALSQAKKLKNKWYKEVTLAEIAIEYSGLGEHDMALDITNNIKDKHLFSTNLGKIANKLAKTNPEKAKGLLESAVNKIRVSEHKNEIPAVLAELSGRYEKLNQIDLANNLLEEALQIIESQSNIPLYEKLSTYAEIAANLVAVGNKEKAFALFDKAYVLSNNLNNPFEKAAILAMLGGELAEKGQPQKALVMLEKAQQAASMIEDKNKKNDILSEITRNLSQAKENAKAEILSKSIDDYYFLTEGLIRIAKNYSKIQQQEKALGLLNDSIIAAKKINSNSKKALTFAKIASELANIEQNTKALQLLSEAMSSIS
ncbi:MAG: hypothetical protein U5N85_20605 [Arcicella sp.]|nr:hypothetical protein [Arcicella sp.]